MCAPTPGPAPATSDPHLQTPDVVIFSQRRSLEVWTPSPELFFRPGPFFDPPGARRGPPEAEDGQEFPVSSFFVQGSPPKDVENCLMTALVSEPDSMSETSLVALVGSMASGDAI